MGETDPARIRRWTARVDVEGMGKNSLWLVILICKYPFCALSGRIIVHENLQANPFMATPPPFFGKKLSYK